jgi:cobalamin biosynthesis protein CobT
VRVSTAPPIDETAERAARSVREFRKMLPNMTAFAQALTGDPKMRVVPGPSPMTDGRKIYMAPRIELGDPMTHPDRAACNERDHYETPVCAACRVREGLMVSLYHEIAHIIFDSFEEMSDAAKIALVQHVLTERGAADGTTRAGKIAKRIDEIAPKTYVEAGHLVSPFLPLISNALEDARVNAAMFKARPGVRVMFRGRTSRLFSEGLAMPDGRVTRWYDAPPNAQATVGLLAKASGYNYDSWFTDDVLELLADDELTELLDMTTTVPGAREIFEQSIKALEIMRRYGFCKSPEDPEDDEQEQEPGGDESGDDEPEVGEDDSAGEGAGSDDDSDEGGPEGTPCPNGDPGDSDETGDGSAPADGPPADGDATEQDGPGGDDVEQDGPGGDDVEQDGPPTEQDGPPEDDTPSDQDAPGDGDDAGMTAEQDGNDDGREMRDADDPFDEDAEQGERSDGQGSGVDGDGTGTGTHGGDAGGTASTPDPMGTPDEVEEAVKVFGEHADEIAGDDDGDGGDEQTETEREDFEMEKAISQSNHFDRTSRNIFGVRWHTYDDDVIDSRGYNHTRSHYGAWSPEEYDSYPISHPAETVVGPSLMRMRRVFSDNRKAAHDRNRKSGKLNNRVLGRRIATGDERLFKKKTVPNKKDYLVVIGLDVSGSTAGYNLPIIKSAAYAQADLLHRTGVPFVVIAHSGFYHDSGDLYGGYSRGSDLQWDVDLFVIKSEDEPWNEKTQQRLAHLSPAACNLDGHTMEQYRKICDRSTATDKIIMYYTDGSMPAENYDDELAVLTDEIETCRKKGYTLMAVGVNTDAPLQHGLDTVTITHVDEVPAVVRHLESKMV